MTLEENGVFPYVESMQRDVVVGPLPTTKEKSPVWHFLVLRVLALCATASAAIVMALNKQTKTMVLAMAGNTPITATITVKFQHMPAFVFFVIANAIASLHNLGILLLGFFVDELYTKGFGLLMIAISDMVMVGLVSSGAAAAVSMGELAKHGNSHAHWNRNCDKFETFCNQSRDAFISSFTGAALLMGLNLAASIKLYRSQAHS